MALKTGNQTGLSNGIAKQEGFPTSGEVSANAGALPAQRAQQPFAQKRAQTNEPPQATAVPPMGRGTLNGGAVQGAQYRTAAQQMSPGVAGFVAIPSVTQKFAIPAAGMPGATPIEMKQQQQPMYFAPQPSGQKAAPAQGAGSPGLPSGAPTPAATPSGANIPSGTPQAMPTPSTGGIPSGQMASVAPAPQPQPQPQYGTVQGAISTSPTATAKPPATTPSQDNYVWNPQKQMYEMGSMYQQGGAWDVNQQQLLAEKQRQQNLAAAAQAQLMGRGGTIGQVAQNYANQMAALEYEQARAGLHQQAQQQQFTNQIAYAQSVAQQKERLIALANSLGFSIDEAQLNQLSAGIVSQYGDKATEGQILEVLKGLDTKPEDAAKKLNVLLSSYASNAEAQMVDLITKMSPQALRNLNDKYPNLIEQVLADTWGDDNDAIVAKLNDAGIYI